MSTYVLFTDTNEIREVATQTVPAENMFFGMIGEWPVEIPGYKISGGTFFHETGYVNWRAELVA